MYLKGLLTVTRRQFANDLMAEMVATLSANGS